MRLTWKCNLITLWVNLEASILKRFRNVWLGYLFLETLESGLLSGGAGVGAWVEAEALGLVIGSCVEAVVSSVNGEPGGLVIGDLTVWATASGIEVGAWK